MKTWIEKRALLKEMVFQTRRIWLQERLQSKAWIWLNKKNWFNMPRLNEHLDRLLLWSLRSQKYIARACLLKIVERWRMFFKNKSLVHLHVQFLHRHVEGRRKARQPANPSCKYWPASQSHSCWLAGNQIADKSQMLTRIFSYRS